MKIFLPASLLLSVSFALANGDVRSRGLRNGPNNGNNEDPEFLNDRDLPPGLAKNIGVPFKKGKKLKAQKVPRAIGNGQPKIRGLDGKLIVLDTKKSERLNMFNPEQYEPSSDGTYVTDKETGEEIPLSVFRLQEKGKVVTFALDEDGKLFHARVYPEKSGTENEEAIISQHFTRDDKTDLLLGYMTDDVDTSLLPVLDGDVTTSEGVENDGHKTDADKPAEGHSRRRKLQAATWSKTRYGKTCSSWDYLDVVVYTDRWFQDDYPYHKARVQAIFAEAGEDYWQESCTHLYLWKYTATVWRDDTDEMTCATYLGHFRNGRKRFDSGIYRDVFHMFTTGPAFQGPGIGCAWVNQCESYDYGYGMNNMGFAKDLRLQSVMFAHEVGHNLGLNHLSSSNGKWIMEPGVNMAPYQFYPNNAVAVRKKMLSSSCGWY